MLTPGATFQTPCVPIDKLSYNDKEVTRAQ